MYGIQSFVGGGGAFGKDKRFARERAKAQIARNTRSTPQSGGGGYNQNQNNQSSQQQVKNLQQKAKDFQFAEDLKKLAGPAGSGTFLFTQHPGTKAFQKKYGLTDQDIINLRTGITQRGFQGNIRDVGAKALKNFTGGISPLDLGFNAQNVISQFQTGMTPFDRVPSDRGGVMGFLEDKLGAGGFSSFADKLAGGSPQGAAGLAFGRNLGLEGDRLNQFASVIANDRDLYNQMGLTNFMKQREIDQFSYDTQRGLPTGRSRVPEPEPDPITAAYNPSMNPFLTQGIQPFSYMV